MRFDGQKFINTLYFPNVILSTELLSAIRCFIPCKFCRKRSKICLFFFLPSGAFISAASTPRIYLSSVTYSFIFVCSRFLRFFGHVPTPNSHYRRGPSFKKQIFQRQQSGLYRSLEVSPTRK